MPAHTHAMAGSQVWGRVAPGLSTLGMRAEVVARAEKDALMEWLVVVFLIIDIIKFFQSIDTCRHCYFIY